MWDSGVVGIDAYVCHEYMCWEAGWHVLGWDGMGYDLHDIFLDWRCCILLSLGIPGLESRTWVGAFVVWDVLVIPFSCQVRHKYGTKCYEFYPRRRPGRPPSARTMHGNVGRGSHEADGDLGLRKV